MTSPKLTAVAIPLKSFALAKGRLSDYVTSQERLRLTQRMATAVVQASKPLKCFVVCDDAEVAQWAGSVGANIVWSPVKGLNRSVSHARTMLGADGYSSVIIAHGDLPNATNLAWVAEECDVTVVADRHGTGTNVLAVPTTGEFKFFYGENSATLHQAEASRVGLTVRVVHDEALGLDIDTPSDLQILRSSLSAAPLRTAEQLTVDTTEGQE